MVISFFNVLYSLRLRRGAGIKFVGFLLKGGHSKSDLKIMCLVPCWLLSWKSIRRSNAHSRVTFFV